MTILSSLDLKETGIVLFVTEPNVEKATSQLVPVSYLSQDPGEWGSWTLPVLERGNSILYSDFLVYSFATSPLLDLCSIIHKPSVTLNHTSTAHLDQWGFGWIIMAISFACLSSIQHNHLLSEMFKYMALRTLAPGKIIQREDRKYERKLFYFFFFIFMLFTRKKIRKREIVVLIEKIDTCRAVNKSDMGVHEQA